MREVERSREGLLRRGGVVVGLVFNQLLDSYGVDPNGVRLLRHQTIKHSGRTPYTLWRDDQPGYITYQSIQSVQNRSRLAGQYWASFVVSPSHATLFVGLYEIELVGRCDPQLIDPLRQLPVSQNGTSELELYRQKLVKESIPEIGRISIDWGEGTRSWIQIAAKQTKPIIEISRAFREEVFPGYTKFVSRLSAIEQLPIGWQAALRAARGVYLLTCPRTREQYVGSAIGTDGLFGRWRAYTLDVHGGNVGLKGRDPSDYQVSILEASGSSATEQEILASEQLWKLKLQSLEMGLNRN